MIIVMKKLLIACSLFGISVFPLFPIYSEEIPGISWTKLLGTNASDGATGVSIASDGSIYISGFTYGDLEGQSNNGSADVFLTKYSSDGTKVWTKLLAGSSYDRNYGISTANDGSIYITGYTESNLEGQTNNGATDAFLTKFSSDGTKVWTKLLGTSDDEYSQGVSISPDGSIYITGYTFGDLEGQSNSGASDAFLTKFSSDGTKVWTKLLAGSSYDRSYGVSTANDGSIYITGYSQSNLEGQTNNGGKDIYLTKFSSDGAKVWTKLLGTSNDDWGLGTSVSSDGAIYITGKTNGELDGQNNNGDNDGFLIKYSSDGTKVWTRTLGSSSSDRSTGISTASDGSIYITGYMGGSLDGQSNSGNKDVFVSKYSSDGTKLWTKLIGTNSTDIGYGVSPSGDDYIYISGHTQGNLNGETNSGDLDAFLIKLAAYLASSSLQRGWVQPYAAIQNIGLDSIKNHRDLVLDKAGSCNNYGWIISDTDYCVYSNVKNTISEINGDSIYGGYYQANFNTSLNIEKTINDKYKAGISYGYGSSNLDNFNFSGTTANFNSKNKHYSLYAVKKASKKFTLQGMIGGSHFDYSGNRNHSSTNASSSFESDGHTVEIKGIWNLKKSIKSSSIPMSLKSSLGIAYAAHNQEKFSESGSGTLITIESNKAESLLLKTGVYVDKQIFMEDSNWFFVPSIAFNYELDAYANKPNRKGIQGSINGDSNLPTLVSARNKGAHVGDVKVAADFILHKDLIFNINAKYALINGGNEHAYGGGFRWQF